MYPVSAFHNFVLLVAALSSGVFLALIIYGSLKEKEIDNPT